MVAAVTLVMNLIWLPGRQTTFKIDTGADVSVITKTCYDNLTPKPVVQKSSAILRGPECDGGFYGDNCSHPCGHCADGQLCDKIDGHCQTCAPGYVPQVCHEACRQGFYGQDCKQECGNCIQGTVCDHVTGLCSGCVAGFDGALCKAAENNGNKSNLVGAIVGAVVGTGVFLGVAILLAAVLVIRSRRSNGTTKPDEPEFQRSAKTSQETVIDGTEVGGASNVNTEDPYDELENYENTRDERAPYTRLEPGASATPSQDNQYEKLATQYHNTEDVKPYEALSLPSGKKGKQAVQSNPTANRHSAEYVNSSGNTGKHVYSNTSFPHRK
ncbi:hypothetical protein BaRGS_00030179 [Batillaria attramentaria]|uniref:Uncharacterized protein n=1 Tax=Batillaria attramentaria TaxID=370345 RepID=A0ABD0JU14_9CAEN